MRMIDTSGNQGEWKTTRIERDSVSPKAPDLEVAKSGDIFQEYLSLKLNGEAYTQASVNITSNYGFNQNYNLNFDQNGHPPKFRVSDIN